MTLQEASKLEKGDIVIQRRHNIELEVVGTEFYKDNYGGSDYYLVECRSPDGEIMKRGHKELVRKEQ